MESVEDRLYDVAHAGAEAWLAWAAWLAIAITVLALFYLHRQLQRNRRLATEQTRPHVAMFMEPHAADWHVIELVVRNFGKTAAYDIRFSFDQPPTVARYETASDGYADVVALQLPEELTVLAPNQEWRTVWDSAIDRAELGEGIESRFTGTISYADSPASRRAGSGGVASSLATRTKWSSTGRSAPGAPGRVDDDARPGQAREAEAGAAAQSAQLLPLRQQRDPA